MYIKIYIHRHMQFFSHMDYFAQCASRPSHLGYIFYMYIKMSIRFIQLVTLCFALFLNEFNISVLTAFEPYMHVWGDSVLLIPHLPIDFNHTVQTYEVHPVPCNCPFFITGRHIARTVCICVLRLSERPFSRLVGEVASPPISLHPPSGAAGIYP